MLSVNCILLWFIDIYLIKVEFICKRNTFHWSGFFFSPFFSVAATSRMNHQKKRFFSSKFGLSICFIDIRTTTV